MIVIAALAALVFSGIVSIPFGNSFSVKVKYAEVGDIPCPTADSKPVAPSQVSVTVINTTQHQGLASKATDMLTTAGFQTEEPKNDDIEYTGKVRITAGVNGVDNAYSVARFFPGAHVRLTEATDSTVTVELGTFYDDAMSAEDVQRVLKSTDPIEQPAKCRPRARAAGAAGRDRGRAPRGGGLHASERSGTACFTDRFTVRSLNGGRADRLCPGLVYYPAVRNRSTRTRRARARVRSTARRGPWPRSCRAT